ncbi:MAG: hypothetical protein K0S47_1162 [Herbinix sp.]|jgi:muramoyltetrapeptide carboxypeptidase LdcA involved in peptidoglycan recycling|nr:hypothetical protein [Herbinix sp.]
MIYPLPLEKGYRIGVTAPSDGIAKEVDFARFDSAVKHFYELGYPVTETAHVRRSEKGRSCDGNTRAKELLELVQDDQVRVIIAASGGDYLVEMLSHLDLEVLKDNPKWMQGFSDITGLSFTVTTNLDIATIYANNFGSFGMKNWHNSLVQNIRILEGQDIVQESFDFFQDGFIERITGLEEFAADKEVQWKILHPSEGKEKDEMMLSGRAIGGCLDVLLNLVGTRFDTTKKFVEKYQSDGILWYLESFALGSESLVRGLWQLKEAGWFQNAVGFIFGRPCFYHTDTDTTYEEAIISAIGELGLPIILEADIGHKPPQLTMMNGAIATVYSKDGKGNITFKRR